VAKAVLLLSLDGLALAPATLCAEGTEEARELNLPLFDHVLAELTAGRQIRANGGTSFELFQAGERVALLEIFNTPDAPEISNR